MNATATQPEILTSTIVASAVLVTSARSFLDAMAKADEKREKLAKDLTKEVADKKLDRKGARTLLESALTGAYTQLGEKQGLKGNDLTAYVALSVKKMESERSRIVTIATSEHQEAIEEARKKGFNAHEKLAIAQGKETVASVEQKRAEKLTVGGTGGRPDGNAPATSTTPTPQAQAAEAAAQGLSPSDKFGNQVAALIALGKALKLTFDEQQEIIMNAYAKVDGEPEAAPAAPAPAK